MLDQKVSSPDLPLRRHRAVGSCICGAVVLCHVCLENLGVCAFWGIPSRLSRLGIEIVWEVLGVGMTHLPIGGEAGFGLNPSVKTWDISRG